MSLLALLHLKALAGSKGQIKANRALLSRSHLFPAGGPLAPKANGQVNLEAFFRTCSGWLESPQSLFTIPESKSFGNPQPFSFNTLGNET